MGKSCRYDPKERGLYQGPNRPLVEDDESRLWRWELGHSVFKQVPEDPSNRRLGQRRKITHFTLPVFLIFMGPPVFALIYTFGKLVLDGGIGSWLWYGFATLITTYAALLLYGSLRGPKGVHDPGPNEKLNNR